MSDSAVHLDGNAAAAALAQFFGTDMTVATTICGTCGHLGPMAELRLYGRGAGLVLRCPTCEAVNVRMLHTDHLMHIDASGLARISIPRAGFAEF
jgi:hypothetical protein